jgi:hypothetical protein
VAHLSASILAGRRVGADCVAEATQAACELAEPNTRRRRCTVAVASLATLTGLFVVLDARTGDQRLALAGLRPVSCSSPG